MNSKISYCGQVVKDYDPDRFLLSMFAPAERREALWALFAFNHEIAKTREVVSETQLGLIRLQWWREAIAEIYAGQVREHEILQALEVAIQEYNLQQEDFEQLIYAREFDLEDVLPANVEGTMNYADFTSTPLMKMAVQVTGGEAEMEAVQPVAMNYALMGILRAVRSHAAQQRCYLPEDLLKQAGINVWSLYKGKQTEKLPPVIEAVAGQYVGEIKPENRFLKGAQVLADIYMKQIRHCKYDVFSPKMAMHPGFKALRLIFRLLI